MLNGKSLDVPGTCVECGKPGVDRYPPHTKCLCPHHQDVTDIVSQVTEAALPVIVRADLDSLELARTRLLRARNAAVKLKAIGVRMRQLEREALAKLKGAGR